MSRLGELRSGAMPDYEDLPGGYPDWLGDGLAQGQAERIAAMIDAESRVGREGGSTLEWDLDRDSYRDEADMRRRTRPTPNGPRPGYGDPRVVR